MKQLAMMCFTIIAGYAEDTMQPSHKDLIPETPGRSPNYWCTWAAQNYTEGQGETELDPILHKVAGIGKYSSVHINEKTLFGDPGWLVDYFPKVRGDLFVLLDSGWDIPVDGDLAYTNSCRLDPRKYPSFTGTVQQNLQALNERVKASGWRGVGLWFRVMEPALEIDVERRNAANSEEEYNRLYWGERMDWSDQAEIEYWKMDMGGNDSIYRMMSDMATAREFGLMVEHGAQSETGPFNTYPGNGLIDDQYLPTAMERLRFSQILRLYDISPQLGIATTLERMARILDASKNQPEIEGLLNCDDEVYLAAALGGTMGVLRHPMIGLRPGGDPDLYMNGPRLQKKRMDEVTRAVRWQRLAPAFGAGLTDVRLDRATLTDEWRFSLGEFWTSAEDWDYEYNSIDKIVNQCAPAAVTRSLPLPVVDVDGEPPFVIASRHPNGAVAVGTLGRMSPEKGFYSPEAEVTLHVGDLPETIGIFGYYRSLTLILDKPLPRVRIWGQDLAGDEAVDMTEQVTVAGNSILLPGELIRSIGLSAAGDGDLSDPGMVMEIEPF